MSNDRFYAELAPFDDFAEVADFSHYRLAPDDWYVIIADVKGSTRAIDEGRYKDVNMIGAACINAVLNVTQKGRIPFVFGGDGATLMVPSADLNEATRVLLGVRHLARSRFALDLRVGIVAVDEIHRHSDHRVRVAKYRLSPVNLLATFSGGGMEQAERWIKADERYLARPTPDDDYPDLSGLSCRWEPLQANNGIMLSLLLQATAPAEEDRSACYRSLITELEALTRDSATAGKPISDANMKFRWPPRGLRAEIDATVGHASRTWHALKLYLNSAIQWCLDRFDLSAGGYNGRRYRVELRSNTDYRRFDDTLRILLDCSTDQAAAIEAMLQDRAGRGELKFGLHRSASALMTCLVFNLDQGEHIHFVDGSDGGFTAAATGLKAMH